MILIEYIGRDMKKIILILLILLTSVNFSAELDKYESKKTFDKLVEWYINGDNEDDVEVKNYLDNHAEGYSAIYKNHFRIFLKDNKYEVMKIQESNNKSILTVKVTYTAYKVSSKEKKYLESKASGILTDTINEDDVKFMNTITDKLNSKKVIVEEVIIVRMIKKDGMWFMDTGNDGWYRSVKWLKLL